MKARLKRAKRQRRLANRAARLDEARDAEHWRAEQDADRLRAHAEHERRAAGFAQLDHSDPA